MNLFSEHHYKISVCNVQADCFQRSKDRILEIFYMNVRFKNFNELTEPKSVLFKVMLLVFLFTFKQTLYLIVRCL